jgi:hypothetical protein
MTGRRALVLVILGLAAGAALGVLDRALPRPLAVALIVAIAAGVIWWAARQWRWARKIHRAPGAGDSEDDPG